MPDTPQTFDSKLLRPGLHKQKVLSIAKPGTVVAFYDTETTGLEPEIDDHIIEFAGILCRVEADYTLTRLDDIQIYIKNRKPLDPKVVDMTKITEEFLADKPDEFDVVDDIYDFLQQADCVCGHNVPFDIRFVNTTMERHNIPTPISAFLDTLELSYDVIVPWSTKNHKLGGLAEAFHLDEGVQFHSALADIEVTAKLFEIFLQYYLQQNDADTPEWLHPVVKSVSYWQNRSNPEQQRIYVNTDVGSLFYNLPSGFLCGKDCDATHVYREEFDANVLEFIGVNTMKDLLAFRGKKYK